MAGRPRRGRSGRDEELEAVRQELRDVRRELRETAQLMRAQGSGRSGGTQAREDSDHSQRRTRPDRAVMSQMEAMKRFMVMQPPSFAGEPNAELAENWLRRIRRILEGLDIPEERRVSLATYMLVDRADFWWDTMKRVHDTEAMSWGQFETIFLDKYFGEVAKHAKRAEFEHLIQGTMTVLEYESRFSELSRFALGMISEEGEKARRFQQGLRPAIRNRVVPLAIRDYPELVKRALLVEQDMEEFNQIREQRGDKKGKQKVGESSQRRAYNQQQGPRGRQLERHSSFSARNEQGTQRTATSRICFGCGAEGHLWRACPVRGAHQTRVQLQGGFQQQPALPFQPPQFQLPYYQTPQLPPPVQGARTASLGSQTRSSQGSRARGRGRQTAGRVYALTPAEPDDDALLVEDADATLEDQLAEQGGTRDALEESGAAEQVEIVKNRPPTQKGLTLREIRKMEYLSQVIHETLRWLTFSLMVFREAKADVNIGGYLIPKGWKILVWFRAVHYDPEIYPNPEVFNPSRWDNFTPKAGTFLPFGAGSRLCPGNDLAKLEISIFLHYFLLNYRLERVNPGCEMMYLPHPRPVDNCLAKVRKVA